MGMSSGPAGGNGRRTMMSDINVTPMVDVMLVLLIIFMVAAPMMSQGLEVKLPQVNDQPPLPSEAQQTVVTIDIKGSVSINEYTLANIENLGSQVKRVMDTRGSKTVYIRADQHVPYGRVAEVMGVMRASGINNVGLVTESLGQPSPAPTTTKGATAAAANQRSN